jgi:hypothetical protein
MLKEVGEVRSKFFKRKFSLLNLLQHWPYKVLMDEMQRRV